MILLYFAQEDFINLFQKGDIPEEVEDYLLDTPQEILDVLVNAQIGCQQK